MAGKKTKTQKMGQHDAKPTPKPSQGELPDKELDKVTGGVISPRDPQSGLPTGQRT